MPVSLPSCSLADLRVIELTASHEALLQRFFDANPAYFMAVNGEPADPNEAHKEIHAELPPGWAFTKQWLIGYLGPDNELVAMANITSDLLAQGVWHIGLLILATARHGSGQAKTLYQSLESWAMAHGANWLRLGVVQGNARAERFWESLGFVQTRTRSGVIMGQRINTLRVMVKPLRGGSLAHYLALIQRDRPEN
ncbi:MAG: hypothetical protein RL748_3671 [Pseudomonadota bacterium]|jgi:GNAT superfamily N-acetyltransferase